MTDRPMRGTPCEVFAERDGRGQCDRCHVDPAGNLYRIGCEAGCFDDDAGTWRYCASCIRREMAAHDPIGAAMMGKDDRR